jgi:hypothetical protein
VTRPPNMHDVFAHYPQQVRSGTAPARTYVQQPGYYAVHYAHPPAAIAPEAVMVMEEEAIAVFSDASQPPPANAADATITPVYALKTGGTLAIPTGRVFVRFADSVAATSRQAEIEAAGYEIVEISPYAPHTAWVQERSGDIAAALDGAPRLVAIPDVVNVEPQMLMQRSLK